MSHSHDLPPELLDVVRVLEEQRPHLTEPELARVKRRVVAPAPAPITRPTGGFMRSRLAVAILLATGALFSTSGTALGVSALSTELSAGAAQYGGQAGAPAGGQAGAPAGGQVLGVSESSPPAEAGGGGEGAVAGESAESGPAAAQPARQTQALESDRLPFTGYAAIPLLLMGIALLASGLVLRRRAHGAPAQL